MTKSYTGIEIGASQVKLAVVSGGAVKKLAVSAVPDDLVRDGAVLSPESMAEVLLTAAKSSRISVRNCALILPGSLAYTRQITMPYMTVDQLKLNLPYEFRDYITQDKDKYFYDYVVLGTHADETGKITSMDLMAAATLKATIHDYTDMLRRAGFKLQIAIPEEFAYRNLFLNHPKNADGEERISCIIDIGHTATKLYIFSGINFEASRVVDYGGMTVDEAIAEALNVDRHIAGVYKQSNHENCQSLELCTGVYSRIATEIMRAVKFYSFNSGGREVQDIYYSGGGEKLTPLTDAISEALGLNVKPISDLLPKIDCDDSLLPVCAVAIGAAMQ